MLIKEELVSYLSSHLKQLENWVQDMKQLLADNGHQAAHNFDIFLEKQNK